MAGGRAGPHRRLLPHDELVAQAKQDLATSSPSFDGREAQGDAVLSDAAAFRKTCARVKWDVAQK